MCSLITTRAFQIPADNMYINNTKYHSHLGKIRYGIPVVQSIVFWINRFISLIVIDIFAYTKNYMLSDNFIFGFVMHHSPLF